MTLDFDPRRTELDWSESLRIEGQVWMRTSPERGDCVEDKCGGWQERSNVKDHITSRRGLPFKQIKQKRLALCFSTLEAYKYPYQNRWIFNIN